MNFYLKHILEIYGITYFDRHDRHKHSFENWITYKALSRCACPKVRSGACIIGM